MIAQSARDDDIAKPSAEITRTQSDQASLLSEVTEPLSVEDELREWKMARKSRFKFPWRQVSLMASLCFGIASFVLPESVNGAAQWLLYALMAASFYAGVTKRGETKS